MALTMTTKLNLPKLPRREKTNVPRSQAERLWMIGGGLGAFVLFLIGYFFFISPQRAQTGDVNSQVTTTKQANLALQHRIELLREQNKNLSSYEAQLAKARLALPQTSGVSDFLRSLQALGNSTLTDVTGLTVGVPVDVSSVAAGQAAVPTAVPTSSASAATTAPSAAQVPGATTPAVYALPIVASVTGSPGALDKFLDQLQNVQPRAVLITAISEAKGGAVAGVTGSAALAATAASKTTLLVTMEAFVAPSDPGESASLSAASHS
jgi:cytoskeletal protein RodZ